MSRHGERSAAFVHPTELMRSMNLLNDGRDVRLVGDYGIGKSAVLQAIRSAWEQSGHQVVGLAGSPGGRHTELLAVRAAQAAEGRASEPGGSPMRLAPNMLILIDDAQWLDDASLATIAQMHSRGLTRLAMSISRRCAFTPPLRLRAMLRHTWPVEVSALTLPALTDLAEATLHGRVSADLVQAVAGLSEGNAAVAVRLLVEGSLSGALEARAGVWERTTEALTVSGMSDVLLYDLPAPTRRALSTVATLGLFDFDEAAGLVGSTKLRELLRFSRLRAHDSGAGSRLAVTPPALARELNATEYSISPAAPTALREARSAGISTDTAPATAPWRVVAQSTEESATEIIGATASMLRQAREADCNVAWRRWQDTRDYTSANVVLQQILLGAAALELEDATRILTETRRHDAPAGDERAFFSLLAAVWFCWGERASIDELPRIMSERAPAAVFADVEAAVAVIHEAATSGDVEAIAAVTERALTAFLSVSSIRSWLLLLGVRAALECRPREGLSARVLAEADMCPRPSLRQHLLATHVTALLLDGQVAAAIDVGMACLDSAITLMDADAARTLASSLALCQLVDGDAVGAWRTVSLALRIGGSGLFISWADRRLSVLGAIALIRRGQPRHAAQLQNQSHSYGDASLSDLGFPSVTFLHGWLSAEVQYSTGLAVPTDFLSSAIEACRSRGERSSAALLSACTTVCPSMTSIPADGPPAVRAIANLHVQEHNGAGVSVSDAVDVGLGWPAIRALLVRDADRHGTDRKRWDAEVIRRLGEKRGRLLIGEMVDRSTTSLSSREREILEQLRKGSSNRQIAEHFVLSVRTVENHVHRIMRKVGARSRHELTTANG